MSLTQDKAYELLEEILEEAWANSQSAILGARLKATLLERAAADGNTFDEKSLGYSSFSRFVQDSGLAIVKYRGSNDVLITSKNHAEAFKETDIKPPRIRRAFWDAFVRFPAAGEYRGYNPETDEIIIGNSFKEISNAIPITPITKQLQLDWRLQFIEGLEPDSPLALIKSELSEHNGFGLFSQALNQHPQFRARWNKYFSSKVNESISKWATKYALPDGVWLESQLEQLEDIARAKLYAI
jgi:hypothetical protein